ncbi:MAG: protein translocase subunit SecD [Bacillota bacterium]|nr:protein translocase subunit SecD [Bacillota bacterium]
MKKFFALFLVLVIAFGWFISLWGLGPIGPLKDQLKLGLDFKGGVYVVMEAQTDATGADLSALMEQTQLIIEERVNQMGLAEPVVTIEGEDRIRVELPGAENASEAIETIGKVAQLQFALGDGTVMLTGAEVENAAMGQDEMGMPAVDLEFTDEGAVLFEEATRRAANGTVINSETGQVDKCIYIILDGSVISFPQATQVIVGNRAQITGSFTTDETAELSMLIRAGSLPVELKEVQTSIIGPTLGLDALDMSLLAGIIGVGLVMLVMLLLYRIMGLVANIALLLYILLVFWILALFAAVMNLPGIAGIILGIGMAVDANVIIFSRVREEVLNGKTLRVSVDSGFKRAMTTVIDSQITTMIAAVVLYQFGTGAVKGFAMTLMIGIVVSLVTAVLVTQLLIKSISENKKLCNRKSFGIDGKIIPVHIEFPYMKYRKFYFIIAAVIIAAGLLVGGIRGFNMGIDFTGGTMIQLDMGREAAVEEIDDVMRDHGITDAIIVHAGDQNEQVVIKTTISMETADRDALVADLEETFDLTDEAVLTAEQFSASMGALFTRNAVKAVIIAGICMLIYIVIRFEWKFGVAAVAGLIHDVLLVVAFYGLFHIPVNNPFVAAILIVVGYSINDTIVIFDRIRENLQLMKKSRIEELVDKSIGQTIVRSMVTSITTILIIIPLLLLTGGTITEFCLPLLVGLAGGAISSVTIVSPVYLLLNKLVKKPKYKGAK